MIITAMFSWWNERNQELELMIPSLRGLVDRMIAFDGAYEGIPGGTPSSPPAQHALIGRLCKDANIELHITVPKRLWTGEVEKRDALLQVAQHDTDWVLPFDADWLLVGDPTSLRDHLRRTHYNGIDIQMKTPLPPLMAGQMKKKRKLMLQRLSPHPWHLSVAGTTHWYPVVHRAVDDMHVERHHWWYTGTIDGERVSLHGADAKCPPVIRGKYRGGCYLEHRCFLRAEERLMKQKEFYLRRDAIVAQTGVEL